MSKWTALKNAWTPTAVADATNFTDNGYMALQGASSTQMIKVSEIYIGGVAGTSSPCQMLVARDSTIGASSLSGVLTAAQQAPTAALAAPPVAFSVSTTKPQRSSTLQLLAPAFNAFGGVVRWYVPTGEEISMVGNTASLGELSLSHASTGTPGPLSSHIIYEPL